MVEISKSLTILQINFAYGIEGGSTVHKRFKLDPSADSAKANHSLHVPDAFCDRPIEYTYLGDHFYYPDEASITSGEITLEQPSKFARKLYLLLHVSGMGQFHANPALRGDESNSLLSAGGEIEGGFAYWPIRKTRPAWRFEFLRLGVMFNSTSVQPLQPGVPEQHLAQRRVAYVRGQAGFGVQSPWFAALPTLRVPFISLGTGFHLTVGRAVLQRDAIAYFDPEFHRFDFGIRPTFDIRFRWPWPTQVAFARRIELVARHSLIFLEDAPRVFSDLRGEPAIDLREGRAIWATVGVGLALSI